jgi:hypothetical protein
MTPFSHELAKQGHPCQTRSGKEVKQLTWFATRQWVGIIEGEPDIDTWNPDGTYIGAHHESDNDLVISDCTPITPVQKYDRAEIAREYLAILLRNSSNGNPDNAAIAKRAVGYADALINELNKKQ